MSAINGDKLVDILTDYFDIQSPAGSYSYNLMRTKEAFSCGTMTFDDFQEFDEDAIEDIADYIMAKYTD